MLGNVLPFGISLGPFPYLQGSETVVLKEGETNDRDQKKFQAERVILTVKCFPKFPIDHVHCDVGTEEKNHLARQRDTWGSLSSLLAGLPSHPELGTNVTKGPALLPQGGRRERRLQFLWRLCPGF